MRFCKQLFLGAVLVLLTGLAARADVKVVIDRNVDADATPEFKFKHVPPPASNDAAAKAKFTIVEGDRDELGAKLDVLNDGKLPTDEDQPDKNFFFAQGQDGGRLALDLGKVIEVKQVNTYSWHPESRGPQVYKLYAADGAAHDFDPQPKKDKDLAKCGWKLVADVDTRTKPDGGGQFGVSVSDSAQALGKYRYLLFDIRATETNDPFGNTFYSEIDVIDAAGPKPLAAAAAPATPVVRLISRSPESAAYRITIDYTEAPELKEWIEKTLQPTVDKWYPKIVEALPSENYTPPKSVAIIITNSYHGVAATMGTLIECNTDWFKMHLDGEAPGAVVHELVHVVQQYGRGRGPNPGWLVEGMADYIRWFQYEAKPTGTRPRNPDKANYTDSYRTTAGFLNFVVEKHDKQIVKKFNAAMREGKYSADLWKDYTGKTPEELWKEYVKTL